MADPQGFLNHGRTLPERRPVPVRLRDWREVYEPFARALEWWFTFLRRCYWRIEVEGVENIPASGRAVIAPNHRGFMPLDAVMHLYTTLQERRRVIRFLIIPSLLQMPFLSNFLTKLGGVIANQDNASRLLAACRADASLLGSRW